jgi:taurine dioxygenase
MNFNLIDIMNKIGREISCDITEIDHESFTDIRNILFAHKVVLIKNQDLTDAQLLNFAKLFGPVFDAKNTLVLGAEDDKTEEVVVVGNNAPEFQRSFLGHQEVLPHSDHQWVEKPSSISMLYAIDVDSQSAPTTWTDTTAVYNELPDELKGIIQSKEIITFNPFYRPFGEVSAKYVNRDEEIPPGEQISHPLVRTHPVTGEKILYMHRAYEMEFKDTPYEEGFQLWKELNRFIDNSTALYQHHWENGDLIIWDNRATLHYRPSFDKSQRRVLKRISIAGEKPF